MDALLVVEPPACYSAYSTEAGGSHYLWKGYSQGQASSTDIGIYHSLTETWTLQPTKGTPPTGQSGGSCAVIKNHLYCFGGYDTCSRTQINDLHELDLETFSWQKMKRSGQTSSPIHKAGCGFVPMDETNLFCFGGYGVTATRSSIIRSAKQQPRWTNESHLYNLTRGAWMSLEMNGQVPPPCSDFSFTKVDQDRAVLFGGNQSGNIINDLYVFDLNRKEVAKVEPESDEKLWPPKRMHHAACCLNYGDSSPKLLIFGGLDANSKLVGDMWLLDISSQKWTEVSPMGPVSVKPRYYHSVTATSLGPGLTEVLIVGGKMEYEGSPIAQTLILRFECSLSPGEWTLVGVANNKTRGTKLWLDEKKMKIAQAYRPSCNESSGEKNGSSLLKQGGKVDNREMSAEVCQTEDPEEISSPIPESSPFYRISSHPDVIFHEKPQERELPLAGGHVDFDNGVEVNISPAAQSGGEKIRFKVVPSFAPSSVFEMPKGIQSASPSYLMSCTGQVGDLELTITIEHHVHVSTREVADDLYFLQADPIPGEGGVYKYYKVSEGRSKFTPGENKGILTTKNLSERFIKIGRKSKPNFSTQENQLSDHNLYTFLNVLDTVKIPQDYPEVSTKRADRITQSGVCFENTSASLNIHPTKGWRVEGDKDSIFKVEVDLPEAEMFKPEDLHDYPPRILCRFYPERNVPEVATCSMSFNGLKPDAKFKITLKAPHIKMAVDTAVIQMAAQQLKSTVSSVSNEQLSATGRSIMALIEKMTDAVRSSSLSVLAVHTDTIEAEVKNVLTVYRKMAEECTRHAIREDIETGLSKMETLSHQLRQVAKVKLKHCQNKSEEEDALYDLVENGARLLKIVDSLLSNMKARALSVVNDSKALTVETLQSKTGISNTQLDRDITEHILPDLAGCFDEVETYLDKLNLTPSQQTDVKDLAHRCSTTVAMTKALKLWRQPNPFAATFRALLELLLDLKRGDVAFNACQIISKQKF